MCIGFLVILSAGILCVAYTAAADELTPRRFLDVRMRKYEHSVDMSIFEIRTATQLSAKAAERTATAAEQLAERVSAPQGVVARLRRRLRRDG